MGSTALLPAPRARTKRIARVGVAVIGVAVIGVAVAAFGVQRSLVVSAPAASSDEVGRSIGARATLDAADGVVPNGVTVSAFDQQVPAVGMLDPDLLDALRAATADAQAEGVGVRVNSGWRSPDYQEALLADAVARYRSREEAARWVATAETSAHVTGDAVDIGPPPAAAWLSAKGAAYGLCQIYGNESWHFELRPDAALDGCPPMYTDPTDDPRMQP